jgi:phosphoesterase RecJ-like protein
MFKSKDIVEALRLVNQSKNIVITSHKSPDGDSIGSSLALWHFLKQMGVNSTICHPDKMPYFLSWLPGADQIVTFEENQEQTTNLIHQADLIFCLDYNSPSRIGKIEPLLMDSKAKKIMIDHHQNPDVNFVDILFSDPDNSSTSQLIYEFIEALEKTDLINENVGTPMYCGIMTDTGSFRFPSTTAKTHLVIADLIEKGVKNSMIHEQVFDTNTISKIKLTGYALSEKLTLIENNTIGYIALTEAELKKFNYKKGDTEGLVNQILSIQGVKLAAFFKEEDQLIKISFRAKGNTYVNVLAGKNFNGGGHVYAAGGRYEGKLDDAVKKFVTVAPKYVK